MVKLQIDDDVIPVYDTEDDVPEMSAGSIVKVAETNSYYVEDGN